MEPVDFSKARKEKLAYVGSLVPGQDRDADAWFTPQRYLDMVRECLGGTIDLDPMSSVEANERVRATKILTKTDDAILCEWPKVRTAFMNPPYSSPLCAQSVDRFLKEFEAGTFQRGIVLVNNASDTRWFARLADACHAMCFTDHRIAFENVDGKRVSGNTRGQTFFYFNRWKHANKQKALFKKFKEIGHVVRVVR